MFDSTIGDQGLRHTSCSQYECGFLPRFMHNPKFGLFVAIVLASMAAAFGQPPINDDFANRIPLTGSSTIFTGTLAGATFENPEVYYNFPGGSRNTGGSVWWTWTASETSLMMMTVQRDYSIVDSSNTTLYVYTGSDLSALTLVDNNSFDWPSVRYVIFSANAGTSYQFRVAGGWVLPFTVTLTATNQPVFLSQPQDCAVSPYGSAFFSAMATGLRKQLYYPGQIVADVKYQWRFNGNPIPGATAPSLLVHRVTTNQLGTYSVTASNAGGVTASAVATLTLIETNPVPQLACLPPANPALVTFSLTGETGRWYKIESSSDVTNWPTPGTYYTNGSAFWILYTNTFGRHSIPKLNPLHQFVRASLHVPTDVCIGQMKQMRWAKYMFAIENRVPVSSQFALDVLKPYLPLNQYNGINICPENGYYAPPYPNTLLDNVTCNLTNRGHVLPSAQ